MADLAFDISLEETSLLDPLIEHPVADGPPLRRAASALHRPLVVLAVCAVGAVGFLARDVLIPTAGAVVLALLLTPVANALERLRLPSTLAAAVSVLLLGLVFAGICALAIPSIENWIEQAPLLTRTLQKKLEGLRQSLAFMQELTNRLEEAATTTASKVSQPTATIVMSGHSMLGDLASTTPMVMLQIVYAGVLAFMLLSHRNTHRRQLMRIPSGFNTRVRLARVLRDINERVGYYLLSLTLIYAAVAAASACVLAVLGLPNPVMWGALMGVASFVPFVGPPTLICLVSLVGLLTFDDWRIVAVPAGLTLIHFGESQFVTPTFVSRRCALNTVAVFVTIGFLGWMWGPVGAIVAVPLLILVSTIAAHLPALRWLEVLLADDRPVSKRLSSKPPLASIPERSTQARPTQARRRKPKVATT